MRRLHRFPVALAAAGILASCGAGGDAETVAEGTPSQDFQMRSGQMFDDDSQKLIDKFGAANPMFDKSGQRKGANENAMVNQHFDEAFSRQQFKGDLRDYEKRSFWGSQNYAREVYGGDTDGGRFLQSAREGAVDAREGSRSSRYDGRRVDAGRIDRSAAREADAGRISKPSDAETDIRRDVFRQPDVKDWRNRRALNVEDTRAMLGR